MARDSSVTVTVNVEGSERLREALQQAADDAYQQDLCVLLQCFLNLHGWVPLLRALKTVAEREASWSVAKACEALVAIHSIPDDPVPPPPPLEPSSNQARDTK